MAHAAATTIGMILFPQLTQLDLAGPHEVFTRMPNKKVYLLAKTLDPVLSDHGMKILPDVTFENTPKLDVLFVPGGVGVNRLLEDEVFLSFLRQQGELARYVTSVCTGSLLLAAAGLLDGYRATTHWLSLDILELLGVEVVRERVVIDRNRITGGGVTAGIDFGLVLAAEICGEDVAREIQLMLEYDPAPPFRSGSPKVADASLVERVTQARAGLQAERWEIAQRILENRHDPARP